MNETQQEHYVILNESKKQDRNHNHYHHHQRYLYSQNQQAEEENSSPERNVLITTNNLNNNNSQHDNISKHQMANHHHHSSPVSHENQVSSNHSSATNAMISVENENSRNTTTTTTTNSDQEHLCSLDPADTSLCDAMVTLAPLQTPQENASSSSSSGPPTNQLSANGCDDPASSSASSSASIAQMARLSPSPVTANNDNLRKDETSLAGGNTNNIIISNSNISPLVINAPAPPATQPPVSESNSSTTTPLERRYRPQKYCAVCGDKAIACNFNAVTCESCKAFFRRNAFKDQRLKCLFDNRCIIDRVTRRFCSKCRLLKCLQIGMKREWILTEEQKQIKKVKIMQNKQSRQQQQQQQQHFTTQTKQQDSPGGDDYDYDNSSSSPVAMLPSDAKACPSATDDNLGEANGSDATGHRSVVNGGRYEQRPLSSSSSRRMNETIAGDQYQTLRFSSHTNRVVETKDATTSCPDEFDLEPTSGNLHQDHNHHNHHHHAQQQQQVHYCSLAAQCQYCSLRLTGCAPLPPSNNRPQPQHVGDYQQQQHLPTLHNLNPHQHQHLQNHPSQHQQLHHHHQQLPAMSPQAQYGQHQQVSTGTIYGNGEASSGQLHQPAQQATHLHPSNMVEDGGASVAVAAQATASHWQPDMHH